MLKRGYLGNVGILGECGSQGACLGRLNLSSNLSNSKLPVSHFLSHVLNTTMMFLLTILPNQWV